MTAKDDVTKTEEEMKNKLDALAEEAIKKIRSRAEVKVSRLTRGFTQNFNLVSRVTGQKLKIHFYYFYYF